MKLIKILSEIKIGGKPEFLKSILDKNYQIVVDKIENAFEDNEVEEGDIIEFKVDNREDSDTKGTVIALIKDYEMGFAFSLDLKRIEEIFEDFESFKIGNKIIYYTTYAP